MTTNFSTFLLGVSIAQPNGEVLSMSVIAPGYVSKKFPLTMKVKPRDARRTNVGIEYAWNPAVHAKTAIGITDMSSITTL